MKTIYTLDSNSKNQLQSTVYPILNNRLALDNCKKIIAMSSFAKFRITKKIENWNIAEKVKQKLSMIHPNFPVRVNHAKIYVDKQPLQFVFIGHHLARKGRIVALRVPKRTKALALNIRILYQGWVLVQVDLQIFLIKTSMQKI